MLRHCTEENDGEENPETHHTLFVSEENRKECPKIKITILRNEILALIDTGCEVSLMNENVYNKLRQNGLECLELPTQHINLVSAFNRRSNKIKKQALLLFQVERTEIPQVVLLSPQLVTEVILGIDFLMEYLAIINFPEKQLLIQAHGEVATSKFCNNGADQIQVEGFPLIESGCKEGLRSQYPQRIASQAVSSGQNQIAYGNADIGDRWEVRQRKEDRTSSADSKPLIMNMKLLMPRQQDREEYMKSSSEYGDIGSNYGGKINALVQDKDDQWVAKDVDAEQGKERKRESKHSPEKKIAVMSRATEVEVATANATNIRGIETENIIQDGRSSTTEQLKMKSRECNNLAPEQQDELYELLRKYQSYLTKRPGRCTTFEYQFNLTRDPPKSVNSRPVPFALRNQIRDQIQEMLQDGILEESFSDHVNPLTIVTRENKPVRICIDARRVNQHMIADRTKVLPLREQLQKFRGSKYISALDLSKAFLQVPLNPASRKWTAFQFMGKVYQYRVTPFGYKNSQAAFIRALEKIFGEGTDQEYLVTYVDDLIVHSETFAEHMTHLDQVLTKLTTAGFTVNVTKCQFCQTEIKFLGHIISDKTVRPDHDRIEAILRYPAPKTQKQLRKFLGVCNFHKQFIINYASYVEPLLVLLRKGNRWKWTKELQQAFETLRKKFAESICLVHPDENKDWIINTDASGKAIASVLMQDNGKGGMNIISTTSRVLKPVEQRYTTCEKELLAIVDALQKFKVHIYGRKVILNTDNRALTFLNKCIVTSNRVARWMIDIQQVDLEIKHIKGVDNHLADILSRSPRGLTEQQTKDLSQPDQIMIHKIEMYKDKTLQKELQTLATLQDTDRRLAAIKGKITSGPNNNKDRYWLQENVLYCRGNKTQRGWRAMLPSCLEQRLIQYVHLSLGHLGVDKCSEEIKYIFHVNNLGRKLRRFIACCDVCQKVKHPNRSIDVEERHHLPKKPGDIYRYVTHVYRVGNKVSTAIYL